MPFNVEYTLSVLRCKKRALSATERAAADAAEDIDTKYVRPTDEEVKKTLEKIIGGGTDEGDVTESEKEAVADLT